MTATAHALVGGAIASTIPDPLLGITLAALSHPLLDMIPHWDEGLGWRNKNKIRLFAECSFDLSLGIILTFMLFGTGIDRIYLMLCILASVSWDILEAPYLILNWKFFPFNIFYKMQSKIQGRAKAPFGILTQVATVLVIIVVLQNLSSF